jgi:hypothetical protein
VPQGTPTAAERKLAAQLAAHEGWAQTDDRSARTKVARDAFLKRFLDEAGGDPVKAENLRKAHYLRLALKSAQSRRRAKQTKVAALKAELDAAGGEVA